MKNVFIIIMLLIFTACSSNNVKNQNNINFSDDMSLEEFKINLKVYSNNNPYPNIDN